MARYEVQTYTICDGWVNCWSEDVPGNHIGDGEYKTIEQTFDTEREAEDAILEFFADLSRAGISQQYDLEDYRVVRIADAV